MNPIVVVLMFGKWTPTTPGRELMPRGGSDAVQAKIVNGPKRRPTIPDTIGHQKMWPVL